MNLNALLKSSAGLIVGLLVLGQAGATTYNTGVASSTPYVNFVSITGSGVSFVDVYNFDIASGMQAAALSIQNHALTLSSPYSLSLLDLSGLSLSIYDSANNLIIGPSAAYSGVLLPGSYHANVNGLTTGTSGGAYSFSLAALAIPPVPEAGTWAMLLAGLPLIGFASYRRRATRA